MKLNVCPKCGKEVKTSDSTCPNCGLVLKPNIRKRKSMSPQQLFDEANTFYRDLIINVKRVGLVLESIPNSDYSTDIALNQIDLILQFMLLTQAVSDGELDQNERIFIDEITKYGNLLGIINQQFDTNLSWDSLTMLKTDLLGSILHDILPQIVERAIDFIEFVARADAAIKDIDFYAIYRKDMLNIAECLAGLDGDWSDNTGNELFDVMFGNYFLEVKRKYE